jgi:hypothetical protein
MKANQADTKVSTMCRVLGGEQERLLRMARSRPEQACGRERGTAEAYRRHSRRQRCYLRGAEDLAGVARYARRPLRCALGTGGTPPRGAPDASSALAWSEPPTHFRAHHATRQCRPSRAGLGQAQVFRRGAESAVGQRYQCAAASGVGDERTTRKQQRDLSRSACRGGSQTTASGGCQKRRS